jgi:alginate O-acetyltransferase complex protein AlgJ
LNRPRPDVVKKILQQEPEGNPLLQCGFVYDIVITGDPVAVGFKLNERNYWLGLLHFEKNSKVLIGRRENLFLDNDTNHCIEQFQGTYPIPLSAISAWVDYIQLLEKLEHEMGLRTVFLVAPGKEFVHSDDFPYVRGIRTPVDEVMELFGGIRRFIYPIAALAKEKDVTYSTGDTHWTDYGAMVAAQAVCENFGDAFPLNAPPFRLTMRAGDLAKKLAEPVKSPYFIADFSPTDVSLTFSNGIHNHGRVHRYENPSSPSSSRVLLFGDSFSVNLAPWLCLCYREVMYIHTAGSIDTEIVEKFKPDILIAQTNTRFLVRAPIVGLHVPRLIIQKLEKMTVDEFNKMKKGLAARPESEWKVWALALAEVVEPEAAK